MRLLIQRVESAQVEVEGRTVGSIGRGLLILLGITGEDGEAECEYLAEKAANLRIFTDSEDKMNLSLLDTGGEALVVSQFTLYGDCRKGRRPAFIAAARPEQAEPLYRCFVQCLERAGVSRTATGEFGAHMRVSLVNDGPVTIWMDTAEIMPNR
ncbi:MAG: D-aminoacyl-tRNA deacylase [Oscillospiraceae bacterium]|jgi:D-tyrosyl-tRNA(Tyr) deacylase|nr:D-aminoacyl-tRNA deacylase [Oscillospiraceae bacterium]MDY4191828.1 D-aminoacyl-tRNA deacylase [Oscillospiraceae bacterium]